MTMIPMNTANRKWKVAKTKDDMISLIDYGVVLRWREFQSVKKLITEEEQIAIMKHFAVRLAERVETRLSFEITLESALVWMANSSSEKMLQAFLEALFEQPNWERTVWLVVEVGLTSEVVENEHDEEIFAMAVVLSCELGLTIRDLETENQEELAQFKKLTDHIATYLVSVSNSSSTWIRLSLMHYFGVLEQGTSNRVHFNRIMSRFGHTLLDNLFNLLFNKKSEALALQYLQDNLPFVLCGDNHCQRVFHETARYFMLKNPERFALFLQTFSDHVMALPSGDGDTARKTFVQHLGLLLKVTSDVNHKQLARDVLSAIGRFDSESGRDELIKQFADNPNMVRRTFRDLIGQVSNAMKQNQNIDSLVQLRSSKRGRKPSFSRVERVATIHQVAYLAQQEIAKAG